MRARRLLGAPVVAAVLGAAGTAGAQDAAPPQILHGPEVFRLTNYQALPTSRGERDFRYAMIFRYDHDPLVRVPDEVGGAGARGDFKIAGYPVVDPLWRIGDNDRTCFVGYLDSRGVPGSLKRTKVGQKVPASLTPTVGLTPELDLILGATIDRRVTLRSARAGLKGRAIRKLLRQYGCRT